MNKYYKVVDVFQGKLVSFVARGDAQVEYKKDEFVKPKIEGSKLFVFDNLYDAKTMAGKRQCIEIWECEIINPSPSSKIAVFPFTEEISEFWKNEMYLGFKIPRTRFAPTGTVFCDEVKLIKRVQ